MKKRFATKFFVSNASNGRLQALFQAFDRPNPARLLPLPLFDYTPLSFGPSVTASGSQLAIQNLAPHGVRRRGRRVLPPASGRGLRRRPIVFTDQGEPRTAGRHLRMAYSTAGTVPVGFVGTFIRRSHSFRISNRPVV